MGVALLLLLQAASPGLRGAFDHATFDATVLQGIARGAYPGAALVVGRSDTILFAGGYGRLTWSASSAAATADSTIYDLASLTKVVATTTAVMILVERGRVSLDTPVARYVPEFAGRGTEAITVHHLLTHTSGLPATLPLHRDAPDAAAALAMALAATPIARPGARVVYSDVNAIVLGEVVRRAAGEPLDRFAAREVFAPLGLSQTVFRPSRRSEKRIAPTGAWRGHPIAGIVNDANAAKMGGVAGHAGAFSTAADVARFAQFMLREGTLPNGRRIVRAETVRLFTTRVPPPGRGRDSRALGWQAVPTGEEVSSAGTLFGPRSYGHTGWTGTSLWIDPDRDLFVVLLTNRAYAPRNRRSFTVLKQVRGRVADAAARASDAGTGRPTPEPDVRAGPPGATRPALTALAFGARFAPQGGALDRLRWLAGCWELRRGDRTTLEMWMPPEGGLMLGASRTTVNGALREFEQVRLRADGDRLVYTALPSRQAEASFTSAEISDSGFTVENPGHDFPQRITYRRRGADSLVARIEGPGPGGVRGFDFPMRRVACTAPAPRDSAASR